MMPLPAQEKLKILQKVLKEGFSVSSVCRQNNISRKTFYQWKRKYKTAKTRAKSTCLECRRLKGLQHPRGTKNRFKNDILSLVTTHPEWGSHTLNKKLKIKNKILGNHGVYTLLKELGLETREKRKEFTSSYRSPLRLLPEARKRLVEQVILAKRKTGVIADEFKVSRKTLWKWKKRYQEAQKVEIQLILALKDQNPTGSAHPRGTSTWLEKEIFDLVGIHPEYSTHSLSRVLQGKIGNHGIQNVLLRNGLNTFDRRLEYSRFHAPKPVLAPVTGFLGRLKSVWQTFVPQVAPAPPPRVGEPLRVEAGPPSFKERFTSLAKPFILSLLSTTIFSTLFVFWISIFAGQSPGAQIGLFFATVSLLVGSFFFLYSMKYYFTLALVLSFSTQGLEVAGDITGNKGELGEMRGFRGFLGKIFGSAMQDGFLRGATSGEVAPPKESGLQANLDHIELKRYPFISIHLPFYNESKVANRILAACTSFDYPNYEVLVCDDSNDGTVDIVKEWEKHPQVKVLHRPTREGFKGGALKYALQAMDPRTEFVVVFDADFVPYPDTLTQFMKYFKATGGWKEELSYEGTSITTMPYSTNGEKVLKVEDGNWKVGFEVRNSKLDNPVSTFQSQNPASSLDHLPSNPNIFLRQEQELLAKNPIAVVAGYQWHVLNKSENWITRGVRTEYAGSYVIERPGQEILGAMKIIHGSVYCARADVLKHFGWGTSITEDYELTLRIYEKGFKVVFTPYIQAPSECVSTIKRLIRQRMRWAEGHSFNTRKMFLRLLFGHWKEVKNDQFLISNSSNQIPSSKSQPASPAGGLGQLEIRSIRNSKRWVSSPLTLTEKLEFLYLAPYYLQAFLFLLGTFSWLISETVFATRLPFWTSLWGWSLVLTNFFALPLLNAVGLFLEESEEKDYLGLLSFIALCYIVVPFQAYAAVKGFIESQEGPWFRTPKTGRITDIFSRGRFYRWLAGILPGRRVAPALQTMINGKWLMGNVGAGLINHQSSVINHYLALATANNRFENFKISPKRAKWIGRTFLVSLLLFSTTILSLAPAAPYFIKPKEAQAANSFGMLTKDKTKSTTSPYQDFRWGVLAINTNKSIYAVGETAKLSLGVLNDKGRTVCDAKLELNIKNKGKIDVLSTENGKIKVNKECLIYNVNPKPDYEAEYKVVEPGIYKMELMAQTRNGTYAISDSFKVEENLSVEQPGFDVQRIAHTRIYPLEKYPVILKITPREDFEGIIEETIPSSFSVSEIENLDTGNSFKITDNGSIKQISWNVKIGRGQTLVLGYQYDSPDISPEFYFFGPLTLRSLGAGGFLTVFKEHRQWQLAIDDTHVWTGATDTNWSTATNWNPNTPANSDTLYFDNTCTGCASTIDSSFALTGVTVSIGATYADVITDSKSSLTVAAFTQNGGTFNLGANTLGVTGTFTQGGGTFNGNTGILDIDTNLTLNSGANFSAPDASGALKVAGNVTIDSAAAFTHNSGTLTLDGTYGASTTITATTSPFNLVTISRNGDMGSATRTLVIAANTTIPLGNTPTVTLNNTNYSNGYYLTNNGTITAGTGTWTANIDGTFTNNNAVTFTGTTWTMNGNFTNASIATMSAATTLDFSAYGDSTGSLALNNGSILTTATNPSFYVTGSLTFNTGATVPANITLTLDGTLGSDTTINAPGYTFATPVTINRTNSSSSTRTLIIAANTALPFGDSPPAITLSSGSVGSYNLTNNGTITAGTGTWTANISGTFTNNNAVTFTGTTWTMNGSFTNAGIATMSAATTLDFSNYGYGGAGGLTLNNGSILTTDANPSFKVAGSLTFYTGATVPANITLTLDGTLGSSTTIDAPGYTFAPPVTINRTQSSSGDRTLIIAANTALPFGDSPPAITLYGTGIGNYNLTNNGTITAGTGTWTTSVRGTFTNNNSMTFTGTTWTMNGSFTNAGTVNMPSVTTLDFNSYTYVGYGGAGNFTNNALKSFTTASNPTIYTVANFTVDSTSSFPTTLGAFILDGTSGTQTINSPNITNYGNFSKTAGSTFTPPYSMNVANFTFSGGTIGNPGSAYTITATGDFSQTTGTLGGANLTILMSGSNTQTISHTAGTFSSVFKVNKSGGSAKITSTNFTVTTQNCTVEEGTFDINGRNFTYGGTFTIEDGGNLTLVGSESNLTPPTLNTGSTVTYKGNGDGSADSYQYKDWTYSNLTVNMTDSSDTLSHTSNTLLNGLIAYWKMDEASWNGISGEVVDSSVNGNNGTAENGATTTAGKFNNGGIFDGINDDVNAGNTTSLQFSGSFTVSLWVKTTGLNSTTQSKLIGKETWSTTGWHLGDHGNYSTNVFFRVLPAGSGGSCGTGMACFARSLLNNGTWHLVTGIYNGSNVILYLDGLQKDSRSATSFTGSTAANLLIGQFLGSAGGGLVDDVRIYNRVITSTELADLASGYTTSAGSTITSLTVNNNLTISSGEFTAPASLTIGGNFTKTGGTFTHNSGNVVFDGVSTTSTLTYNAATDFYNLTATDSGKVLKFDNVDQTNVTGAFTINGQDCLTPITLSSDSDGNQFDINVTGTYSVQYAHIQDSNAIVSLSATNSKSISNNTNWTITQDTCATSTSSQATAYSFQRKTWYDGTQYWKSFYSGTQIEFWYSNDSGLTWTQNTSATISVSTNDFTIEADTTDAFIAYTDGYDIKANEDTGTYPATNFAWGGSPTTVYTGSSGTDEYDYPAITKDSNNKVWITATHLSGTDYLFKARQSTIASDISAWGTATTLDTSANSNKYGTIVPLSSGQMYAVWIDGTTIEGKKHSIVDKQMAVGADDGRRYTGTSGFSATGAAGSVGYSTNALFLNMHAFARWTGVTISGTIDVSYIQVYREGSIAGSPELKVYGVDQDNPAVPTSATTFDDDPLTDAAVDWDGGWGYGTWVSSPPLNTIFQELVDTYTISAEAVMVQIKNDIGAVTAYNAINFYETSGNVTGPKLHIEYWGSVDSIATGVTGLTNNMSAVSSTQDSIDYVHLIYDDASSHVIYDQWDSSNNNWTSFTNQTLDDVGTCEYLTLSKNTANNDLYALWIRGDDIYYSTDSSPYTSWSGASGWQTEGTNNWATSNYSGNGMIFAEWTSGAGSPYAVSWDYIIIPERIWLLLGLGLVIPGWLKGRKNGGKKNI